MTPSSLTALLADLENIRECYQFGDSESRKRAFHRLVTALGYLREERVGLLEAVHAQSDLITHLQKTRDELAKEWDAEIQPQFREVCEERDALKLKVEELRFHLGKIGREA